MVEEFWFAKLSLVLCLIKDQLPKIKTQLLQAFEKLERVAPSTLMTISMHSIIHIPDKIELFGPISGFVWALAVERWMLRMKDFVTATIGFSANIIKNYQLSTSVVKLSFLCPDRYKESLLPNCKLSSVDPRTGSMLLQLARVRPFKERSMTLSDDDRCHLHHHLWTDDYVPTGNEWQYRRL
ncbi:unnamed protein product (mitochondrion) [Plasmodiophora brassicae]|uniref:DUF4218 domain-containing protein n=1 Tax=Plasmodiophora brassicae TaxID=37360 RepID=A0A3P3YNA4_PLABS|nr:unnamed protein product [Plasmodiophora brassicae]